MSREEAPPQLPIGDRSYFACRQCRLILTEAQFLRDGCAVCASGPVSREELLDAATPDFSNFIGLIAPEKSWVARLIGRVECPNGVFAAALHAQEEEVDEEDDEEMDGAEEEAVGGTEDVTGKAKVMTDDELLAAWNA